MDPRIMLVASFLIFGVGTYCLVSRRDLIRILISLQVIMNAVNLIFIIFSSMKKPLLFDPLPQEIVITSIVIDGCIIAVGLVLVILIFHSYRSIDVEKLRKLRW